MDKIFQIGSFCFRICCKNPIPIPYNFLLFANPQKTEADYTYHLSLEKKFDLPSQRIIAKRPDLLVMENENARVKGQVNFTATGNDNGEIDNTEKGVIEKTVPAGVVVFATVNEINLDDHANTVKALKDYTTATRQVTVFRLIGELKRVQSMENGKAVELTNDHVGEAVTAIEFMAGSSITLGEVTVESKIKFIARAKNILVNGRTDDTSILKATTGEDYRYLGKIEGKYKSELGSFKTNNSTIQKN